VKTSATSVLISAALLSFVIALLHIVIIGIGSPGYLYFGAADMAELSAQGSWVPAMVTWGLTAVFVVFGLYALAGAGVIRGLPFVRVGVVVIGGAYTLRGLVLILDLVRLSRGGGYPARQTVFSAVSLAVGLMYLAGAFWRSGSTAEGTHVAG
jgi:hypothetical protein